jgi:hypothetical protein
MKILCFIVVILVLHGCGLASHEESNGQVSLRDTTVVTSEWRNGLFVHHHVSYDSSGQVRFQTEQVTAFDTVSPRLSYDSLEHGRAFAVGPYTIWTPALSNDTLRVMLDTVRIGQFDCTWRAKRLKGAHVLERRTAGYGTYSNTGSLVVPENKDTVFLWTMVDFLLPKPAVWNWDKVTPMTYDEYRQYREDLKKANKHLATPAEIDSLVQANK